MCPRGDLGLPQPPCPHHELLQAPRWLITTGWSTRGGRGELRKPPGMLGWLPALAPAPAWLPGKLLTTPSLLMGMGPLGVPRHSVPAPPAPSAAAAAQQQGAGRPPALQVPCQPRRPQCEDPQWHRPCYGAKAVSQIHNGADTAATRQRWAGQGAGHRCCNPKRRLLRLPSGLRCWSPDCLCWT